MKVGNIRNQNSWLAHPITAEILKLAKEHPDYPIVVKVRGNICADDFDWCFARRVYVCIREILDCDTEWWGSVEACDDRREFEEVARYHIVSEFVKEAGIPMNAEAEDEAWEIVRKTHEPYWKKVIVIYVDN